MPALSLTLALTAAAHAAAAIVIGACLCGGDDDDLVLPNSYYSSPRSASTWIQTQPSYRPPPLLQAPYRPPATYAQTTPRTPAPPDYSRGVDQPRAVPPYTRTPSQTQSSSTLTQQSSARTQPSIAQSASTSSRVPSRVPTERDRLLPTASGGGYHSSGVSTYTRTPSQKQPSSTITQPSSTLTRPSSTLIQPSPTLTQPSRASTLTQPSTHAQPPSTLTQLSSTLIHPPLAYSSLLEQIRAFPTRTQLSSTLAHPPLAYSSLLEQIRAFPTRTQLSSTLAHPPLAYSSLLEQIRARSASTSSHLPSCAPAERDPYLPTVIQVVSSDVRSNEPAAVEDLDFAEKLREQAQRRGMEMTEAYSRAKLAQKKGSRGAAQEHRQRGHAHKSAMKELNKRAAVIIFMEKNKDRKDGAIDLHGLHVAEAIRIAKVQVQTAWLRGDKVVHFIVGKGLHANDGEAKIRPALQDLFTKQGLTHSLDPKNSGVLIIQL